MESNQNNQTPPPLSTLTPEETLQRMQRAVNHFYREAVHANYHPFLEMAGLMEEYLKVCRHNLERGTDFRDCHAHKGIMLHLESWHVNYINEKLRCIFNGALTVSPTSSHPSEQIPQ